MKMGKWRPNKNTEVSFSVLPNFCKKMCTKNPTAQIPQYLFYNIKVYTRTSE